MSKVNKTSIRCMVTGKTVAVRPEIFDKRVEKFGSVDDLLKNYISRDAKRMLREGKTVTQIRQELGTDASDLPSEADLTTSVTEVITSKAVKPAAKKSVKNVETVLTESESIIDEEDENMDPEVANFLGKIQ